MDTPLTDADAARTVPEWLDRFAAAVRTKDYVRARTLFDSQVVSFGTVATRVSGVERLIDEQWRRVWEMTEGFEFRADGLVVRAEGDHAFVAAEWSSSGLLGGSRETRGSARDSAALRHGRATVVLRRTGGRWLAVHTHFSLVPPPWADLP